MQFRDNMDANVIEAEKHLLETMCKDVGIRLGEHAMFFKPVQYGLSYQEGHYVLEIPMHGGGLSEDEEKELKHRLSNSVLQTKLAHWLYYITVRDPSFLNKLHMVKREPGKRNGTKVVRECQKKLLAALNRAEESISAANAYHEST